MDVDSEGVRERAGGIPIEVALNTEPDEFHLDGGARPLITCASEAALDCGRTEVSPFCEQVLLCRRPGVLFGASEAERGAAPDDGGFRPAELSPNKRQGRSITLALAIVGSADLPVDIFGR